MDRLSKAINALQAAKKSSEWSVSASKKIEFYEKERAAFSDVKEMLIRPEIRKDSKYSDEFNRAMKILFEYINHRDSDLRMLSEQTMDSVLRHLIIDMNTSRVVVVLMSEIKRCGPSRSLVFALSRLLHVLKHVKINRSRAIGIHLISALQRILIRPEEAVQSALERYLPPLFAFLGSDFEAQRTDNITKVYEVAVANLELSGVANRTAAVVISQLATFVGSVRKKAFYNFLKVLSEASEEENRNRLVGTLNSLRLIWPVYLERHSEYELQSLHNIIRGSMRCLFSSHSEIVVAALEFLEKVVSSPLHFLDVETFYPQQLGIVKSAADEQGIAIPTSLPSSHGASCMSSLRASPTNFIFGGESPTAPISPVDSTQHLFNLPSNTDSSNSKPPSGSSSEDGLDIIDPLRHLETSKLHLESSSSSEESLPEFGQPTMLTAIPEHLPNDISFDSFLTYAAVLLAKRFLLSGECLKLLADREVRVSHKILAMSCLSSLALYLPKFADIPLQPSGGLGVQTLKDLQLYLNHEDDQLKAAAIVVFVNAGRCKFRALGERFREFNCSFKSFVYDVIHLHRAHCSRSLLVALKCANRLVYQAGIAHDVAKFACENYRDNYFLLRIAIVDYLASIEWAFASSSGTQLPDEVFGVYMHLLADDDQRVRNAAAENLPLLTKNANYTSTPNNFTTDEPNNYLCSAFHKKPLTIGLNLYYDFVQQSIDFVSACNLSIVLKKMFDILTTSADEKQQAGFADGLHHLLACYKTRPYAEAWGLEPNVDSSRIGLIISLLSNCGCCCTSVQTFVQFLDIATHMTAGLYTLCIMKVADESNEATPKLPEPIICEQLLLFQLRILNLYYCLIIDHRQQAAYSRVRPSPLSPVRKALPVGTSSMTPWEQRIAAISTFAGVSIKMSRNTSFLKSSTLTHFADSLKGAYLNYINTFASDSSERFTTLLISALNCLACTLEVMRLSQVADIIEEVLLYCRTVVEIAPEESIRVSMQLFKILFGSNAANVSLDSLRSLKLIHPNSPKDLVDVCMLRSANCFTDFVVNTGHVDYGEAQLAMCAGWLNKAVISKETAPPSTQISSYVAIFEPFVSLTIRLYQSTNSADVQCSILDLLCILIRGGINYAMLDPETRLLNFVIEQVNEVGAGNRADMVAVEKLLDSIFCYFLALSHTECRGQMIMESFRIRALVDYLIKACDTKPFLGPCALSCLHILMVDSIGIHRSFDSALLKMLQAVDQLITVCPTRVIQLWALAVLGSRVCGDAQNWTKTSLSLFESFQQLSAKNWDFSTSISAIVLLRSCCSTALRPVDSFFNKMIRILEDDVHCFSRLVIIVPYLFMFLCVLKEGTTFTRIEQICGNAAEKIGLLLMQLLEQCLVTLRRISFLDAVNEESVENLVIWYLLILSHAVRSGNMEYITNTFKAYFSADFADFPSLSLFYPHVYAQLFAFMNSIGLHVQPQLYSPCLRQLGDLYAITRCRLVGADGADEIIALSDFCSADVFLTVIIRGWLTCHMRNLDTAIRETLLATVIERIRSYDSAVADLDVVELIASADTVETSTAIEFFKNKFDESVLLDSLMAAVLAYYSNSDAVKVLLRDFMTSENYFANFICKRFEEAPELAVDNHNLGIGDPELFTSEVFADVLQKIVATRSFDIQAESICIMLCKTEEKYAKTVLRKAYEYQRCDVLSSFIDVLEQVKAAAKNSGELYNEYASSSADKVDALSASFVSLAFDQFIDSPLQLFVQSRIADKPKSSICEKASDWVTKSAQFDYWVQRYVDSLTLQGGPENSEIACASAFAITRRSFLTAIDQAQNSKKIVAQQLSLAVSVDRLIQHVLKRCNTLFCLGLQKSSSRYWNMNIIDRTGKKDFEIGFFSDAIQTAFDVTQRIQEIFHRRHLKNHQYHHLERLAKAVIRLPFLNDISCIPRSALLCGWKPEPEIHHTSVSIPTVNIYYLGNVDILRDFVWRILWAGWNRRSNFDNFSMSLFGVISSTPSGSELTNANMNMTEQIMASTVAVEGLTNLLLETLLYPERGNPVTGIFIAKPRDASTEFLASLHGQRLCMLQAKLSSAAIDPAYRRNLEILNDQGKKYHPGQFSVLTSWNMTGVLDQERDLYKDIMQSGSHLKERLPSSDSSYLLDSGHDATYESCLRMLFDTFSHWFRAGVDTVPLPLLSATIKSMSLLSDLFTELDQYRFVFGHMKTLFAMRSYLDSVDIGNVIYSLLKCVAVLGFEDLLMSKVDAQKAIATWIEAGLSSEFTEIRVRTLQGSLFLLQAVSYEDLKSVFVSLESFLLGSLEMSGCQSVEYETMLWTVRFFFFDNPSYSSDNSRNLFINMVCENFIAFTTPGWLMNLITAGIERLIVGSRMYLLTFSRIAVRALESYFNAPQKFFYALRIFIACIYRGLEEGRIQRLGTQPYDPRIHLMEQHATIFKILAEGAEEDASQLMKVLPYLLVDALNQSELINSILKELIHRYAGQPHPRCAAIFVIIHHWFAVLHSRETESIVLEWTLNGLDSFKYVTDPALFRFYVNAFLCSSSSNPYIANLFYVVIGRTSNAAWIDNCLFAFCVRSLLLRMNKEARNGLKASMEKFVVNGKTCRDPRRIAFFPVV